MKLLLAAGLQIGCTQGFDDPVDAVDDDLPVAVLENLDSCMAELVASPQLSGAAVAVVYRGETTWMQGYGTRHPDHPEPVDLDTRFRVGSVTKVMTASTAMSLVADGTIHLETPVDDLLPPFGDPAQPEYAEALTLRRLLSHQGGFYDLLSINGPREDHALADAVLGDLFAGVPYLVEPGTFFNYSNANYSVAGLVVERVAGVPFRSAVDERLFDPLGMTRSTFDVEVVEADGNYAYGVVEPSPMGAEDYDNGWGRPAGFAWSSVEDLATLTAFLLRGDPRVLPPWAHAELMRPQVDTLAALDRVQYGLGLLHAGFIAVAGGVVEYESIEHDGGLPGYSALVHLAPELELGFAFVANGNDVEFHPCIAAALEGLPDFDATPVIPELGVAQTEPMDYVGEYREDLGIVGDFTISRADDGGLRVSFPSLDEQGIPYHPAVVPVSRDNFHVMIDGTPILLTGIFDKAGKIAFLRTRRFVARPAD